MSDNQTQNHYRKEHKRRRNLLGHVSKEHLRSHEVSIDDTILKVIFIKYCASECKP